MQEEEEEAKRKRVLEATPLFVFFVIAAGR
jgi:hypothetical protein